AIGIAGIGYVVTTVAGVVFSKAGLIVAGLALIGAASARAGWWLGSLIWPDKGGRTWGELVRVVWGQILETVTTTWAGIQGALKTGDLAGALKIGLKGAEVEWRRFVLITQSVWNEWKRSFVDGWHQVVLEIKVAVVNLLRFFADAAGGLPKRVQNLLGMQGGLGLANEADMRADAAAAQRDRNAARDQAFNEALEKFAKAKRELEDMAGAAERFALISRAVQAGVGGWLAFQAAAGARVRSIVD